LPHLCPRLGREILSVALLRLRIALGRCGQIWGKSERHPRHLFRDTSLLVPVGRLAVRPLLTPATHDHNAFLDSFAPEDEGLYDDEVGHLTPETQVAISKGFYSAFLDSYTPEDEGLYDDDSAR
jgi:hypothetical protein